MNALTGSNVFHRIPYDPTPVPPVAVQASGDLVGVRNKGVNKPVKGHLDDGTAVVFKHNEPRSVGLVGRFMPMREFDIREVVASHIFHDELGLPAATYREAYVIDASGQRRDGIISELIPDMHTLETCPVSRIKNPDVAVAENVVKGWMGDWDIVHNRANTWIKADGEAIAGDFGQCFQRSVTNLGIPNASSKILTEVGTRENIEPVAHALASLSDEDIHGMVDRQGRKWIHDWTPAMSNELSGTLIHNRDQIRHDNPWLRYIDGRHPFLHDPLLTIVQPLCGLPPMFRMMGQVVADALQGKR